MTFDDISTIKAAANSTTDKNVNILKKKQKGNPYYSTINYTDTNYY